MIDARRLEVLKQAQHPRATDYYCSSLRLGLGDITMTFDNSGAQCPDEISLSDDESEVDRLGNTDVAGQESQANAAANDDDGEMGEDVDDLDPDDDEDEEKEDDDDEDQDHSNTTAAAAAHHLPPGAHHVQAPVPKTLRFRSTTPWAVLLLPGHFKTAYTFFLTSE